MKKLFYFACASLLALGTVSCDDDDEAPVRSLSATPGTLTFTATPDTPKTIDVKAENVSWKATTEAGWLTLKNAEGTADGTITVEAQSNTTTDPQNATIVIKAEGVDDVTITVTQDAGEPAITEPAIIWDRSSRSRMNLQGDVKTVSVFGNHLDDTFIYNLTFDDNGMLSSYDRMYGSTTVHFTLTYDGENRLTKIATDEFAIDLATPITGNTSARITYSPTSAGLSIRISKSGCPVSSRTCRASRPRMPNTAPRSPSTYRAIRATSFTTGMRKAPRLSPSPANSCRNTKAKATMPPRKPSPSIRKTGIFWSTTS